MKKKVHEVKKTNCENQKVGGYLYSIPGVEETRVKQSHSQTWEDPQRTSPISTPGYSSVTDSNDQQFPTSPPESNTDVGDAAKHGHGCLHATW